MIGAFFFFIFLMLCAGAAGIVYLFITNRELLTSVWAWIRASFVIRFALAGVLTLLLMIPLFMIDGLVDERADFQKSVVRNVNNEWGLQQRLVGPVLLVPYTYQTQTSETYEDNDGIRRTRVQTNTHTDSAVFLPQDLKIDSEVNAEERARSIYRSLVYSSVNSVEAQFEAPDFTRIGRVPAEISWEQAQIVVGVSDTRGIGSDVALSLNDQPLRLRAGFAPGLAMGGFTALVSKADVENGFSVSLSLPLRGSERFDFAPLGETTLATIKSAWPSPSFRGDILPESREVSADGFTATWRISHLARSYGQVLNASSTNFDGNDYRTNQSANPARFGSGVVMFEPVWLYAQATRAVKFGFLFVGLSFLTILMIEYGMKRRLHMVQYGVIGLSLTFVYLLILSLAEHIGFAMAYLIASATMVALVAGYTYASLKDGKFAAAVGGMIALLFAVLYSLLNMQDYSLLVGSGVILVFLIAIMAMTTRLGRGGGTTAG